MCVARIAVTLAIVGSWWAPFACAGDEDDVDEASLVSHPIGGETYLSTSDIVVSGAIAAPDDSFVVHLKDARNVICQSASGNTAGERSKGQWAIRLTLREAWRGGDYKFDALGINGPRTSVPIKILDDERHRKAGRLGVVTELTEVELEAIPIIALPETSVLTTDVNKPKVTHGGSKASGKKDAAKSATLPAGKPFGVAGRVHVDRRPEFKFVPVVLQIIEDRKTEEGEPLHVIVNEDSINPEETETGFQFGKPIMSPRVEGRYTLRALYRRSTLCETGIEVKSGDDSKRE